MWAVIIGKTRYIYSDLSGKRKLIAIVKQKRNYCEIYDKNMQCIAITA